MYIHIYVKSFPVALNIFHTYNPSNVIYCTRCTIYWVYVRACVCAFLYFMGSRSVWSELKFKQSVRTVSLCNIFYIINCRRQTYNGRSLAVSLLQLFVLIFNVTYSIVYIFLRYPGIMKCCVTRPCVQITIIQREMCCVSPVYYNFCTRANGINFKNTFSKEFC